MAPRVVGALTKVTGLGAAAGLGAGATAVAVAGAFAIGYGIGTGILYLWQRMKPEERAYRAALAFRKGRQEFAAKFGRPPNKTEIDQIAIGFRDALARLKG